MAGVCQCKEHFRNLLFWRFGYVAHEQKLNICCTAAEVSSHVDITVEGVLHTITCRIEICEAFTALLLPQVQPCSDSRRLNLYAHYEMVQETQINKAGYQ